jgi:hypothetical protein
MHRAPDVMNGRRKRPKGLNAKGDELEMRRDYYDVLKSCELRKADVLEKMYELQQEQWEVKKTIELEKWEKEKQLMSEKWEIEKKSC